MPVAEINQRKVYMVNIEPSGTAGAFKGMMEDKIEAYKEALIANKVTKTYAVEQCNIIKRTVNSGVELTEDGILKYASTVVDSRQPSAMYRFLMNFKHFVDTGEVIKMPASPKTPYTRPSLCSRSTNCIWSCGTGCAYKLNVAISKFPFLSSEILECKYFERRELIKMDLKKKKAEAIDTFYGHKLVYHDSHSAMWR